MDIRAYAFLSGYMTKEAFDPIARKIEKDVSEATTTGPIETMGKNVRRSGKVLAAPAEAALRGAKKNIRSNINAARSFIKGLKPTKTAPKASPISKGTAQKPINKLAAEPLSKEGMDKVAYGSEDEQGGYGEIGYDDISKLKSWKDNNNIMDQPLTTQDEKERMIQVLQEIANNYSAKNRDIDFHNERHGDNLTVEEIAARLRASGDTPVNPYWGKDWRTRELNKEAILSEGEEDKISAISAELAKINKNMAGYKGVGKNVERITEELRKIIQRGSGATSNAVIGGGAGLAAGIGGSALTDYLSNEEVDEKQALLMGLAGAGAGAASGVYLNNRKPYLDKAVNNRKSYKGQGEQIR